MKTCRALDPPGALPVFGNYRSDGAKRFHPCQPHQTLFSTLTGAIPP